MYRRSGTGFMTIGMGATRLLPIYCKKDMTFGPYRICSATPMWLPMIYTHDSRLETAPHAALSTLPIMIEPQ